MKKNLIMNDQKFKNRKLTHDTKILKLTNGDEIITTFSKE